MKTYVTLLDAETGAYRSRVYANSLNAIEALDDEVVVAGEFNPSTHNMDPETGEMRERVPGVSRGAIYNRGESMRPFAVYDDSTGEIRIAGFAPGANAQQFMREGEGVWISDAPGAKAPKKGLHRIDVDTGDLLDGRTGAVLDPATREPVD